MNATDVTVSQPLPVHLAVIMDGNGRWAQARGLPREAGHRAGAETVRDIVTECRRLGIRYLTLYTFSSENWNRPRAEVTALFSLLLEFLGQEVPRMEREGIRLNVLGDIDGLPLAARTALRHGMRRTAANDGMTLNLALNYGGRAEIVRAVQSLLRDGVVPFLEKRRTGVICSHMARTFGIGEGDAALLLAGLTSGANPSVATYATDTEMYVRITAKGRDAREAAALAAPALAEVRRRLGDRVYGVDVPHLQHVVVDELTRRGRTLATAESCTGGLLASLITDVPGASAVFHAGVVTYANEAKTRLLGVPPELLARVGAVSPEVARRMAEGVRRRHGSDWGVGITGIAGPGGGTPAKPVGLVYIALSGADGTWLRVMRPTGRAMPRAWTRMRAAGHALDMVRRALQGLPVVQA